MSARKPTIVSRYFAVAAFVIAAGTAGWMFIQQQRFQRMPIEMKVAYHLQREGVMSVQDDMRVNALGYSIAKTGRISDADLDWLLALLKAPAPTSTEQNASTRQSFIAGDLRVVKHFTAPQEERVFQAFLPMASGSNKGTIEVAVGMLAALNDSRSVPYIRPLLNDSDAMVRYYAWRALHHLHALPGRDASD